MISPYAGARSGYSARRFLTALLHGLRTVHVEGLRILADLLPKGLYARALIIIIAPIVVLEGVVAFVFMERHWQAVTSRLSEATARDLAALISVYEDYPYDDGHSRLITMARDKLNLQMSVLPQGDLPPARPKPFFDLLDRELSRQISSQINRPYWIDTVGQSHLVASCQK